MFDIFIIGGGINGCGIAADAAERGLKTGLCEMHDLASATSGGSSKLIHGGLRYLEYYEFGLVRKALAEREILLNKAPHLIKPLRFRIPMSPLLRPAWMIRIGLFFYDHLAKRSILPDSAHIRFDTDSPLKPQYVHGFEYSDAYTEDTRLVLANALHAKAHGADIQNYTKCVAVTRQSDHWTLTLRSQLTGDTRTVMTRALVNAAGPWCSDLFDDVIPLAAPKQVLKVKGSHIIVPALHDRPYAYLIQNTDKRVIFVIPYLERFSLIGTTDVSFDGDPSAAAISDAEIDYLLEVTNTYFKQTLSREDIKSTYSAVRPLMDEEEDNPQAVTRDYHIEHTVDRSQAPLVTVFGGKLTTYRVLAKAVIDQLHSRFPDLSDCVSADSLLPGGEAYTLTDAQLDFPWATPALLQQLLNRHGSGTRILLRGLNSEKALGQHFGHHLYAHEIDCFIQNEWAETAEDVLHRRTQHYLFLDLNQQRAVVDYMANKTRAVGELTSYPIEISL